MGLLADVCATNSSVDIPLTEGPVNLNWNPIMKTINEDAYAFFQQGGWSFLGGAGGDEVCPNFVSHRYRRRSNPAFRAKQRRNRKQNRNSRLNPMYMRAQEPATMTAVTPTAQMQATMKAVDLTSQMMKTEMTGMNLRERPPSVCISSSSSERCSG